MSAPKGRVYGGRRSLVSVRERKKFEENHRSRLESQQKERRREDILKEAMDTLVPTSIGLNSTSKSATAGGTPTKALAVLEQMSYALEAPEAFERTPHPPHQSYNQHDNHQQPLHASVGRSVVLPVVSGVSKPASVPSHVLASDASNGAPGSPVLSPYGCAPVPSPGKVYRRKYSNTRAVLPSLANAKPRHSSPSPGKPIVRAKVRRAQTAMSPTRYATDLRDGSLWPGPTAASTSPVSPPRAATSIGSFRDTGSLSRLEPLGPSSPLAKSAKAQSSPAPAPATPASLSSPTNTPDTAPATKGKAGDQRHSQSQPRTSAPKPAARSAFPPAAATTIKWDSVRRGTVRSANGALLLATILRSPVGDYRIQTFDVHDRCHASFSISSIDAECLPREVAKSLIGPGDMTAAVQHFRQDIDALKSQAATLPRPNTPGTSLVWTVVRRGGAVTQEGSHVLCTVSKHMGSICVSTFDPRAGRGSTVWLTRSEVDEAPADVRSSIRHGKLSPLVQHCLALVKSGASMGTAPCASPTKLPRKDQTDGAKAIPAAAVRATAPAPPPPAAAVSLTPGDDTGTAHEWETLRRGAIKCWDGKRLLVTISKRNATPEHAERSVCITVFDPRGAQGMSAYLTSDSLQTGGAAVQAAVKDGPMLPLVEYALPNLSRAGVAVAKQPVSQAKAPKPLATYVCGRVYPFKRVLYRAAVYETETIIDVYDQHTVELTCVRVPSWALGWLAAAASVPASNSEEVAKTLVEDLILLPCLPKSGTPTMHEIATAAADGIVPDVALVTPAFVTESPSGPVSISVAGIFSNAKDLSAPATASLHVVTKVGSSPYSVQHVSNRSVCPTDLQAALSSAASKLTMEGDSPLLPSSSALPLESD